MSRLVYSTLLPSTDSTEILWSPSRVTSAVFPSGENVTWLGPDLSSPSATLPIVVSALPETEKTETVPSARLATSASVPARLIETPAAPLPAWCWASTLGGEALRSITVSLSSGTSFFESLGSTLVAAVTSAKLSSRAIATLDGGPTTLVGTATSATALGGVELRSMMVTESAAGLAGTVFTPSTRTAFPSLAESASWAPAPEDSDSNAASAVAPTTGIWQCMMILPCPDDCRARARRAGVRDPRHYNSAVGKKLPAHGPGRGREPAWLRPDHSPAAAGSGRAFAVRSALSRSASRNARSIDCSALSRGSQTVW